MSRSLSLILVLTAFAPALAHALAPGDPAPQIGLDDTEGNRVGIAQFRGKVLVVSTWASWCEPCRHELPALQRMYARLRGRGLRVVGMNVDRDAAAMQGMIDELGLRFPNVHDPTRATAMRWGATMMPTLFIVDPEGVVRHVHMSYQPGDEREVEREVRALLPEPRGGGSSGGPTEPPSDEPDEVAGDEEGDPPSDAEDADHTETPSDAVDPTDSTADEPAPSGTGGDAAGGSREAPADEAGDAPPPAAPSAANRRGGCCAILGPSRPARGALSLAALAVVALVLRRVRRAAPRG